jgi:hypothetical protein
VTKAQKLLVEQATICCNNGGQAVWALFRILVFLGPAALVDLLKDVWLAIDGVVVREFREKPVAPQPDAYVPDFILPDREPRPESKVRSA